MRTIRAKFTCTTVIPPAGGYDSVAYLSAVIQDPDGELNEENKVFSELTPSGQLTISISEHAPAAKFFKAGRDYYLDFTKIAMEPSKD